MKLLKLGVRLSELSVRLPGLPDLFSIIVALRIKWGIKVKGVRRRRQRAFSLSELRRDILYDQLILSFDINKERMKILEKKYRTCSEAHIYVVTESLAKSATKLDILSELLEAAKNDLEKTVLPIFYGVDPSDVRHQTGSFAEAFADYESKYKDDPQKVERWRAALRKLANLAGWDSKDWPEAEVLIREVVDEIKRKLYAISTPDDKNLASTPSRSSSCPPNDGVFLSFRGVDTRWNFLDHLYNALIRCRISTFRDNKDLEKGISIRKQLHQAIEGSKVSVVIVSPNYASSKWCLDELLKILECRKASKVLRKMNESFIKALEVHIQAQTSANGNKTHKGKANLWNMDNIMNHNKRKAGEYKHGVNYGGKWVGSVYIGGRTEEMVVSEDISYNELPEQLYHIVGVHPNENEIRISTLDESKSPAYPMEIINDDDVLKTFTDQILSSNSHLKDPLQNRQNVSERTPEVRVLVNHGGEWVNSTYVGGKTKGIVFSKYITYQELVARVYGVLGVNPNEYKLIMKTASESNLPTQPVEINDDEDLAFFVHDENLSLGIFTLCTTLERRALPNERTDYSQSSGTTHVKSFEACQSCVNCVTLDHTPYLHTQSGPSSTNVPCMQQQQPCFCQQQHFYQKTTSHPCYEHYQPFFQQPQSPYEQLYPSYMQPQPPIHHVPYSLKMSGNDATRIFHDFNFWQFSLSSFY